MDTHSVSSSFSLTISKEKLSVAGISVLFSSFIRMMAQIKLVGFYFWFCLPVQSDLIAVVCWKMLRWNMLFSTKQHHINLKKKTVKANVVCCRQTRLLFLWYSESFIRIKKAQLNDWVVTQFGLMGIWRINIWNSNWWWLIARIYVILAWN